MPQRRAVASLLALIATAACSVGTAAPPSERLEFPVLVSKVRDNFCIRDNAQVGQTLSGSITEADCNDSAGYYETYVVKVPTPRTVTFAVTSGFDSFLALVEVASFSDTDYSGSLLAYDDDSNGGKDARLSIELDAGVDYAIMVSGLDRKQLGSYALKIQ